MRSPKSYRADVMIALMLGLIASAQSEAQQQSAEGEDPLAVIDDLLGVWEGSMDWQGRMLHARLIYERTVSDAAVRAVTWNWFEGEEPSIGWEGIIGWHPVDEEIVFHGFSSGPTFDRGRLTRIDRRRLHWLYDVSGAKGNTVKYRDEMTFSEDGKRLRLAVFWSPDGQWQPFEGAEAQLTRVAGPR